ncbi:MAG: diaminopimelate epimerase [Actinomycetota bacterium]|nr:diaminopimelate epimerase [Actinomycetota bacterium]
MEFVKMQGLGNDFIVITGPYLPEGGDVVRWCERRRGVGADGVLVVTALSPSRVAMRYWNADGGEAEMCGNGLRCVARLAFDRGWVDAREFTVETAAGKHPVKVKSEGVIAFVGKPVPFRTGTLTIGKHEVHPFAIGNPHAVMFVDDVESVPVGEIGPLIESDPLFPNRTNVEFVEVLEEGGVRVRVWERGVGETLASGTGSTAAAYIAHTERGVSSPVEVHLHGGVLTVWFDDEGAWMDGPAEYVFSGNVD